MCLMQIIPFLHLVCPSGWSYHSETESCYTLIATKMTWSNARANCKNMDPKADLVSIHSDQENSFIQGL